MRVMSAPEKIEIGLRSDEIEITPELIVEGAVTLSSNLGGAVSCDWDDLAIQVYWAMCNPDESRRRRGCPTNPAK